MTLFSLKRCERCHGGISSNELVMRARDYVYHIHCFTCVTCNVPLSKEYTSDLDHMGYESPGPHSQRSKRMRTSFKHHQLRTMKSYFALNQNPDAKDLKQLAQKTGLSKRVLQVWFQNARAKWRRTVLRQEKSGESKDDHR
ncbi:LIM/homeobox protein Lhx9-like [Pollicipes pollicipes]|uniref:LIM/homeobox protein Lhx9-like n=1 Tax=Pollicipes pollicipes TaxID=41117 RepID=UPI00188586F0|nr:LIM/homeobox protein Lhx9-like [Pollicipes pollicipes]